jgi:hypothetical protein
MRHRTENSYNAGQAVKSWPRSIFATGVILLLNLQIGVACPIQFIKPVQAT